MKRGGAKVRRIGALTIEDDEAVVGPGDVETQIDLDFERALPSAGRTQRVGDLDRAVRESREALANFGCIGFGLDQTDAGRKVLIETEAVQAPVVGAAGFGPAVEEKISSSVIVLQQGGEPRF